jgi:hypothetical protein
VNATEKELKCIEEARKLITKIAHPRFGEPAVRLEDFKDIFSDDEVSEIKLFSQLWKDMGMHASWDILIREKQLDCIVEWFSILFDNIDSKKLEEVYKNIKLRNSETFKNFRKENPHGHISLISPVTLLPKEIDKVFGYYM